MTKNKNKSQEKITYNYHTHTYRCHHADGTIEEYIKRAVDCGMTHMGFSDHAPYICTNGMESWYRVKTEEAKDYFLEISALREKYKEKIDIKIGFEMEYYPKHFKKMLNDVIEYGAEYLILGPHYMDEELPETFYAMEETDSVELLKAYSDCTAEGIKSGAFTYVAHPDLINFTGDVEVFQREIRKICIAARECNVPLELNFLGIRRNRNYPNEAFWEVCGEEQSPVTFGFDAHEVLHAYDDESLGRAMEIVKKYNLNYIGKPDLIMIQKK